MCLQGKSADQLHNIQSYRTNLRMCMHSKSTDQLHNIQSYRTNLRMCLQGKSADQLHNIQSYRTNLRMCLHSKSADQLYNIQSYRTNLRMTRINCILYQDRRVLILLSTEVFYIYINRVHVVNIAHVIKFGISTQVMLNQILCFLASTPSLTLLFRFTVSIYENMRYISWKNNIMCGQANCVYCLISKPGSKKIIITPRAWVLVPQPYCSFTGSRNDTELYFLAYHAFRVIFHNILWASCCEVFMI